jgi:hypothetical protein
MPSDPLLAQILLARSEARFQFELQPSAKLQSKIDACDVAIDYLSGHPREFVRRYHVHGNLSTPSMVDRKSS